jgi:hypothetical protein
MAEEGNGSMPAGPRTGCSCDASSEASSASFPSYFRQVHRFFPRGLCWRQRHKLESRDRVPSWTNAKGASLGKNGLSPRYRRARRGRESASHAAKTSRPLPDSLTARDLPHSRVFLPLVGRCQCQLVGAPNGAPPTARVPRLRHHVTNRGDPGLNS